MKKTKENAITLVALVITIIVLLILAGVSIQAISNTGLFANAKKAKEKSIEAQIKEKIMLTIHDIQIEETSNAKVFDMQSLIEKLPEKLSDIAIEADGEEAKGEYNGYNYRITTNYEVIIEGKANIRIKAEITPKDYTKENVMMKVEITSEESPIKRIQEPENLSKNSDGQYVVSKNGEYKFIVETENGDVAERIITVNNIDKLPPKDFKPEIEKSGTTIKIKENAEDQESTEENACSGIEKYEYYIDGKKYDSNEITNLTIGNTYLVYVIAFDKAGNSTKSSEESVKITVQYKKISAGPTGGSVLAIDFDDNLWQWGLANDIKNERGKPKKIVEGTKFIDIIATNGNILFAIDEEKNLWEWPCGNPSKVLNGIKVKKASASVAYPGETIHVIDEEGNLWGWGTNSYGQLGDGSKCGDYLSNDKAKKIAEGVKFKEVANTQTNAYAIDEEGNLWAWGDNSSGLVGNGTTKNQYVPIKISENIQFEEIIIPNNSSTVYAIDNNQNLYGWGYLYTEKGTVKTPTKIMDGIKVNKVVNGYPHYALDVNSNLWGWAGNSGGELGNGSTETQYTPIKVMEGIRIKDIYGAATRSYS